MLTRSHGEQIVAERHRDDLVLQVAAALETSMPGGGGFTWPDLSSITAEMTLPTGARL